MADGRIERAALGRISKLGDLYDARSDSFCGISLLKATIPAKTVTITDNNNTDMKFVIGDNMSEKFSKLDISGELSVSILARLFPLSGSGKYLQTRKESKRSAQASLLYNINTKVEWLNLFADELKDCISCDALNDESATHIVTEVYWGANSLMIVKDENEGKEKTNEVVCQLTATLTKACAQIKSTVNHGDAENVRNEHSSNRNYSFEIFGDVLTDKAQQMPNTIDDAIAMMRKMPELVQKANGGKGKPLKYVLVPLSAKSFREHIKVPHTASVMLRSLENSVIQAFVNLFDEISLSSQEVHDYIQDVGEMEQMFKCVPRGTTKVMKEMCGRILVGESKLRDKLATGLKNVRSGTDDISALESMIHEYKDSEDCAEKLCEACREMYEALQPKFEFVMLCQKHGISYVTSAERVVNATFDLDEVIVLYANDKQRAGDMMWSENMKLFFKLVKEKRSGGANAVQFFFVDCDFDSTAAERKGIRIERYSKAECVDDDMLNHVYVETADELAVFIRRLLPKIPHDELRVVKDYIRSLGVDEPVQMRMLTESDLTGLKPVHRRLLLLAVREKHVQQFLIFLTAPYILIGFIYLCLR